jgi:hypothetical protein
VLHSLLISSSLTWSFSWYTSYEAPPAVFSNLMSLHLHFKNPCVRRVGITDSGKVWGSLQWHKSISNFIQISPLIFLMEHVDRQDPRQSVMWQDTLRDSRTSLWDRVRILVVYSNGEWL